MGGEGPAGEVSRRVADLVHGGTAERERVLASGGNAAQNEVAWARNNLKEAGFIDASTRGIWRLTPEGWEVDPETLWKIGRRRDIDKNKSALAQVTEVESVSDTDADIESATPLLDTIKSLPPRGFERLCQHILRKSGFAEVEVTDRSGDGGIDGHGILQVNELVSFSVLFQCKRYQGSVGAETVRNFRGAMSGRTDKGIILTTGTFTRDAEREAMREGVPAIELVDADKLISLMERLTIGVKPRTVFDVDDAFFDRFRE
jgi:restriction system protein